MKIRERFEGRRRHPVENPSVFPSIRLIPDAYLKIINLLNTNVCKQCGEWLNWGHVSTHAWPIRNPAYVLQIKIEQWKEVKDLPWKCAARRTMRRELMEARKKWNNQLVTLYMTVSNIATPWAQSR